MERTKVATGAPWEELIGYSRAVRVGKGVVSRLISPDMLVEIEADAIVGSA